MKRTKRTLVFIFAFLGLIIGIFFRNILTILDKTYCEKNFQPTPPDLLSHACISKYFGFGSYYQLPYFIIWIIFFTSIFSLVGYWYWKMKGRRHRS